MERVDVLVENAGINPAGWVLSDGVEATIQINTINTLLIAVMLLPKLKESAERFYTKPHLVLVTSDSITWPNSKKEMPRISTRSSTSQIDSMRWKGIDS